MPRWTTSLAAPFRASKRFTAVGNGAVYSVQMHPQEPGTVLVCLRRSSQPLALSPNDVLHVRFKDPRASALHVRHVQHIPSWKGNVKTAVVTGFFAELE